MTYKIYLDDDRIYRRPPNDNWIRLYSYEEFVDYIEANGLPEAISFDHDLGADDKSGKDCANWLVNYCLDNNCGLPKYSVHSENIVGRDNILGLLDGFSKFKAGD